jgi:hypothetical protein
MVALAGIVHDREALPAMSTIAPMTTNKGVFMWPTSGAAAPSLLAAELSGFK